MSEVWGGLGRMDGEWELDKRWVEDFESIHWKESLCPSVCVCGLREMN